MVLFLFQHNHFQTGGPLEMHGSIELTDRMNHNVKERIWR